MKKRKTAKDSTSYLFNRYVWLVDIIYRRKEITFEEINEYWLRSTLNFDEEDMPLRTFHNHRKAIEQMFDINIECDKRNGYKYYIENIDDMEQESVRRWLLNAFSVNNLINESRKLKHRILYEQIPSGQEHLTFILEAMRDNLAIEITYQSFWRDEARTFEIHPYCIKVFKQRWYVIAYSPNINRILTYGLDRIKSLIITDNEYSLPEDFNARDFFADSYGIIVGDEIKAEKVLIRVNENQANYIKALPLHHSQKEEENSQDYTVFSYYIRPTYDFRQELLSHGVDVEVLAPDWFRDEVSEIIAEQVRMYFPNNFAD